jgi:hypothetical protein
VDAACGIAEAEFAAAFVITVCAIWASSVPILTSRICTVRFRTTTVHFRTLSMGRVVQKM